MKQQTTLPEKYNPYKAAYFTRAPKDPQMEAKINAFWEGMKVTSPKLYQKHLREEVFWATERPVFEAMLDDPETIALMEELDAKLNIRHQQKLGDELALLGIEAGATKRDIKNAYRRKARKLHPDKGGSDEDMKHLNAAYKRLLAATSE
jgi:hypothetical protein